MPKKVSFVETKLGQRLRKWHKLQTLTLTQLSNTLGVGIATLSDIENNKTVPSIETLARLYKNTDINIIWLMFKEGDMRREKI